MRGSAQPLLVFLSVKRVSILVLFAQTTRARRDKWKVDVRSAPHLDGSSMFRLSKCLIGFDVALWSPVHEIAGDDFQKGQAPAKISHCQD